MAIKVPSPELQIDFAIALRKVRSLYLQEALSETVAKCDIAQLDLELSKFVPKSLHAELAKHGLRGELLFPVPTLLRQNLRLVGYYRLLLGFSQKEFYSTKIGAGVFRKAEDDGVLTIKATAQLDSLCTALVTSAGELLRGVGTERVSRELLDDLTLLTVGPQLRGSRNVQIGDAAIVRVFEAIEKIVSHAIKTKSSSRIELVNAAKRRVIIQFASDPDIVINEVLGKTQMRKIVAIEVKGGQDYSNIHNRIGEAEKSHQKTKAEGFTECWTVINVGGVDSAKAKTESPSTDQFYLLSDLEKRKGKRYEDFFHRVIGLTGVRTPPRKKS